MLTPLGLRLSAAKTRIVHMSEAFDFLGFRIQWKRKRGTSKWYVYTFIADRPIRSLKAKIRALTNRRSQWDLRYVLIRLNQIMRGSPGVPSLSHDVAPEAQRRAFATRPGDCGARCRCWSEHRPVRTRHVRNASPSDNQSLIMLLPGQSVGMPDSAWYVPPEKRGWANYFKHAVCKHTLGNLANFAWWRVIRWLRTLHRWGWNDVRRAFTTPQGRWKPVTADGIELLNLNTVPVTRYRYRGNTIPSPWELNHA